MDKMNVTTVEVRGEKIPRLYCGGYWQICTALVPCKAQKCQIEHGTSRKGGSFCGYQASAPFSQTELDTIWFSS